MNKDMYFQGNPTQLDISRSKFDISHRWTGTFNTGELVPIYCQEVLPYETDVIDLSFVLRGSTPVTPVMDDAFLDVYFFYVPNRLLMSRRYATPSVNDSNQSWQAFIGAQDFLLNMPVPSSDVVLPLVKANVLNSDNELRACSLSNYFGLPILPDYAPDLNVVSLPFMAYFAIWNDFFRDPNTMSPVTWEYNGGFVTFTRNYFDDPSDNYVLNLGASHTDSDTAVLPVCRFHGYFGSALPFVQRGDAPLIPISAARNNNGEIPLTLALTGPVSGSTLSISNGDSFTLGATGMYGIKEVSNAYVAAGDAGLLVNAVRQSFAIQRLFEALARGGNGSYSDVLRATFGGRSDLPLDRPEYLGGKRIRLDQQQVASTNQANAGGSGETFKNSLGALGAYSLNGDSVKGLVVKSSSEHGYIIGVACVRVSDSFSNGVARHWMRRNRFDYYWPQFAHLGEQSVYESEIFFSRSGASNIPNGLGDTKARVFGYQEAWAEYRYAPDVVVGLAAPSENLGYFTYANNFSNSPSLASFLDASYEKTNVDNTLVVKSSAAGFQWLAQFKFNVDAVKPMPLYSIPGLVDHD